jgi:hypothetical protein
VLKDKSGVKLFTLSASVDAKSRSPNIQINLKSNVKGIKIMIRQILESNLRHAITFVGGWLAAQGYMLELDQQLIGGLAAAGAGLALGLFNKLISTKK